MQYLVGVESRMQNTDIYNGQGMRQPVVRRYCRASTSLVGKLYCICGDLINQLGDEDDGQRTVLVAKTMGRGSQEEA